MTKALGSLVSFSISVILAGACASAADTVRSSAKADSLSESDLAAIRAGSARYVETALKADWSAWASLYAADAMYLRPNMAVEVGREAIENGVRKRPPLKELSLEPLEIEGRGDLAFVRGRYSVVRLPAGKPEWHDTGKFIEIWRKEPGGSWKLFRDIFNSDLPATGTPLSAGGVPPVVRAEIKSASLSDTDVAAIRAASAVYTQAAMRRDWSTLAQVFTVDAIYGPPHTTARVGREAIEAFGQTFPPLRDLVVEPLEIEGRGDLAYARGRWSNVALPPGQPPQPDVGKYIEIWRRQADGTWKISRDIWNSDLPVAVAAISATSDAARARIATPETEAEENAVIAVLEEEKNAYGALDEARIPQLPSS